MKYRLLNIFYNRNAEIKVLEELAKEEAAMKQNGDAEYAAWLKTNIPIFKKFIHERELKRRREKENLEQRTYFEAVKAFNTLMAEIDSPITTAHTPSAEAIDSSLTHRQSSRIC